MAYSTHRIFKTREAAHDHLTEAGFTQCGNTYSRLRNGIGSHLSIGRCNDGVYVITTSPPPANWRRITRDPDFN